MGEPCHDPSDHPRRRRAARTLKSPLAAPGHATQMDAVTAAEVERLLRTEVPVLAPERHRELAAKVTTLAASPVCSISVEAPATLNEPAELRRADGEPVFTEHAAGRFTSQAVLDAETRLENATRTATAAGLTGVSVAAALDGFEARSGTMLDAGQQDLVTSRGVTRPTGTPPKRSPRHAASPTVQLPRETQPAPNTPPILTGNCPPTSARPLPNTPEARPSAPLLGALSEL
jgi:hypothetical protein